MCGFAGLFVIPGSLGVPLASAVSELATAIRHRGPDDSGEWVDEDAGIALGFRRLSIIDLSQHGHQPMVSFSGRFVVLFNGEIYNYQDLRARLVKRGVHFRGHSDTEALAAGFDVWGLEETIRQTAGMFAIAVWDRSDRTLTLVRDRVGIKPLFLASLPNGVAFASEIKALRRAPGFDTAIDLDAANAYLRYLYVPDPRTIYRRTRRLAPGQLVRLRTPVSEPRLETWWSLDAVARQGLDEPFSGSADQAIDELEGLLDRVVREHLIADVPLGAFLSGGIDSSTVAAMAARHAEGGLRTYCVAFDEPAHNEAPHAAAVAAHLGTRHQSIEVGGAEVLGLVPAMQAIFDEPFADASQLPAALLCQRARAEVTVALSGEGGDELFGGYNRYTHSPSVFKRLAATPAPIRRALGRVLAAWPPSVWDRLGAIIPGLGGQRLIGERVLKLAGLMAADDDASRYRLLLSAWSDPGRLLPRGPDGWDPIAERLPLSWPPRLGDRLMLTDQHTYLPGDQLTKADRLSMRVGLEVRVPLLDHRIVEFSWRLPPSLKINGTEGKHVLRKVLHRRVPRDLVERPKVGFTVPLARWLDGPLRGFTDDHLHYSPGRSALDAGVVRTTLARFRAGRTEVALSVWCALMFRAWEEGVRD